MNKILSMIGLAAKAGKLNIGTPLSCDSVRKGKAVLVVLSDEASDNTKKRVTNCCAYYGVELLILHASPDEMGRFSGKRSAVSCIAVSDSNFVNAIKTASVSDMGGNTWR